MDLSKLPRLSQTPPPPPGQNPDAPPEPPIGSQHGFPVIPTGAPSAGTPAASAGVPLFCRCGAQLVPGVRFCSNCGADYAEATGLRRGGGEFGGFWVEAFLSIGIGVFLLLMSPQGLSYWKAKLTGGTFAPYNHPTDPNQRVDYIQMQNMQTQAVTQHRYRDLLSGFWSDTAVTAFALALILEGIILAFVRNRWVILISGLLIAAVAVLNLWVVIQGYRTANPTASVVGQVYGLFPMSALAVIFGVMMAGYLIRLFAELSPSRRG